ncbi:MAG: transcriptional regulator, partial [Thermoleophilia bacterium]|nr:transcriptional regulator [Thermoleophilia bacterium]
MARPAKSDATRVPGENRPESVPPAGRASLSRVPGGVAASRSRELDKLIHERVRLGIVSALAVNDSLTFTELRRILGTSDG